MKNIVALLFSILICFSVFGQTEFREHLPAINGVWIEEGFDSLLDSLGSLALLSQNRKNFDYATIPIGFRFNISEINENVLNIGYGRLHSHEFYPEVSKYCIQGNDTLFEQGHISAKLDQIDSLGFYAFPNFGDYNNNPNYQMKIHYAADTTIQIFRNAMESVPEINLTYKKFSSRFSGDYQYPNPRDWYMRVNFLVGNYTLLDSLNSVISEDFQILADGKMIGYNKWLNKKIEFSTDVFCGGPAKFDKVLIYNPEKLRKPDNQMFIYHRENLNTILFYSYKSVDNEFGDGEIGKDKVRYTLIRKS